jgi:hypothetical protein
VRSVDEAKTLLERPELAGPTIGQRPPFDDAQRKLGSRRASGSLARVVARLIVDDDDFEPTSLRAKRRDRAPDQKGFVARGDDDRDAAEITRRSRIGLESFANAVRLRGRH